MLSSRHLSRYIIILGLFFALFVIVSSCGRKETAVPDKSKSEAIGVKSEEIVARIGEEVITIDDYKEELAMLPTGSRDFAKLHKSQILEGIINKGLLLREAKRRNLENCENVKRLFRKVKEEILIQELIDKEISDKVEVTDSEIEEHYRENQDNYIEPARIRVSHILVDSQIMAEKILVDLKQGADFAELAKKYSLDIPTKDRGGDVGYFVKGALLPEFEDACERLKVGEISEVVKTALGYHIIKVLDKEQAKSKTLEEVKDDIRSEMLFDKEILLYDNLLQELRKNQKITINTQVLENIDLNRID